jgi:hypothetical protein
MKKVVTQTMVKYVTSYLAVGSQGILNAEIYAEDYDGSSHANFCASTIPILIIMNMRETIERDHIRSPYVVRWLCKRHSRN